MTDLQNGIGDQSVADQLRASLKAAQERKELDLVMPRTEPGLHLLFRSVGYAEVRTMTVRAVKDTRNLGGAESDKYRAAELLVAACTGCYVMNGEQRVDLPPLGTALYDAIFPADPNNPEAARPATDREAVFALFGSNDMDLMALNAQYEMWAGGINAQAVEELLGNS